MNQRETKCVKRRARAADDIIPATERAIQAPNVELPLAAEWLELEAIEVMRV